MSCIRAFVALLIGVAAVAVTTVVPAHADPDGPNSETIPIVCDLVECPPPCNAHLGSVYIFKELGTFPPFISTDWWVIPEQGATSLGDCQSPIPAIEPQLEIIPDGGNPDVWANSCTFSDHCEARNEFRVRTKHKDGLENCFVLTASAEFVGGGADAFPWDNVRLECRS